MIYDSIKNISILTALLKENADCIISFIKNANAETPVGKYELLAEKQIYAMVQEYNSHDVNFEKLEVHQNYADIQLLISGEEIIAYQDIENRKVVKEYNPEKDVALYLGDEKNLVNLPLVAGNFAIFMPGEAHLPGIGNGNAVRKIVVKIAKNLF